MLILPPHRSVPAASTIITSKHNATHQCVLVEVFEEVIKNWNGMIYFSTVFTLEGSTCTLLAQVWQGAWSISSVT